MNILLFTPAIRLSAIGRMTRLVSTALISLGHEVLIVRTETQSLLQTPTHDFGVEILRWDDLERMNEATAWADSVVYQVGNHYDFHYGCLEWMERQPGVVCLHDIYLGHLFYGWAESRREKAHRHVACWYGETTAREFFAYPESESFMKGTADSAPMTEWIGAMAHGVITHSSWGVKRLLDSCPGPVRVVALAYDKPSLSPPAVHSSELPNQRFTIVTIGHVNPNKRVESVIRAIGNSALLQMNVTYVLVGSIQPKTETDLHSLAAELGVELVTYGEVDDVTLDRVINSADLISCLRWPSLEAASASAIEAMLYGKPVIVTDTGFYSELPDDAVRKINHGNEVQALQTVIEMLYLDPDAGKELGRRAEEWASQTFTAFTYARQLMEIIESAALARPILDACRAYVLTLQKWEASTEIIDSVEMIKALELFE